MRDIMHEFVYGQPQTHVIVFSLMACVSYFINVLIDFLSKALINIKMGRLQIFKYSNIRFILRIHKLVDLSDFLTKLKYF